MAEETNNLIDQVEETTSAETTEETKEQSFDPLGFMGETVKEEIKGNYDEDKAEKLDESETVSENVEEESDEEGFAWGDIETATQEEEAVAEEPDEDWDEVLAEPAVAEETQTEETTGDVDWSQVAKQLGVEAATKEDLQKLLESPFVPEVPETDTTRQIKEYLSLSDRELLAAEMQADGMEKDDVVDILDKMEDTGSLKREAFRVRNQLKGYLENIKAKALTDASNAEKTRKEKVAANKKDLQNHLKQMKTFMGGRVGKKELQDAYKYIVSGKMADNIWKSHANAAEVAMFMLYKDKFAKILRSQGVEEGKASLFNKISSPELRSGSKSNYKAKKSGFDIMEFMKE